MLNAISKAKAQSVLDALHALAFDFYTVLDTFAPVKDVLVQKVAGRYELSHALNSSCLVKQSPSRLTPASTAFSLADKRYACASCLAEDTYLIEKLLVDARFFTFLQDGTASFSEASFLRTIAKDLQIALMQTLYVLRFGAAEFPFQKSLVHSVAAEALPLLEELVIICADVPAFSPDEVEPQLYLVNVHEFIADYFSASPRAFLQEVAFMLPHRISFHRGFGVYSFPFTPSGILAKRATPITSPLSLEEIDRVHTFLRDGLTLSDAVGTACSI